jgi:putative membrane protein
MGLGSAAMRAVSVSRQPSQAVRRRARPLAGRSGAASPPASPDLASQAKGAVVGVMPGKSFDSQYVSSQLDDHKETLALYQKKAESGHDPELKALASKGIPVIQEHIAQLEELQKMPELQ